MDSISDIFAAIDGAVPIAPFRSFTGSLLDGRACAVAAGRIEQGYYLAYLEETPKPVRRSQAKESHPKDVFIDERLKLYAALDGETARHEDRRDDRREEASDSQTSRLRLSPRYLEYFEDGFRAGDRFRFFWDALHRTPEIESTEQEMRRDAERGAHLIEKYLARKIELGLINQVLAAEEALDAIQDNQDDARRFWEQARITTLDELKARIPDPTELQKDLDLHRYRRDAFRDNEENGL